MESKEKPLILCVDNEINSKLFLPFTKYLGKKYRVIKSDSIADAKKKFKYDERSIDLIILDIHFDDNPNGGIELLEKMRKTDPFLPIGIITQHDKTSLAFEAGQKLATFYHPKPSDGIINEDFMEKLANAIENSLGGARYIYDRNLMKKCNSNYAEEYDEKEYSKPGTIAFCYWEDFQIAKAIKSFLISNPGKKLNVLDIGCGTGRYEVLIKKFIEGELKRKKVDYEIIGMDFSGRMLQKAKRKIEDNLKDGEIPPEPADSNDKPKIRLKRGAAECLPFDSESFNFAISGFGIPSYTKFNLSIPEIHRILEIGGIAVLTVYSSNAIFHKISDYFFPNRKDECPMASRVIKEPFEGKGNQGIYKLAPQGDEDNAFPIQTFTKQGFVDMLNRFNFEVKEIGTFPILASIYPANYKQDADKSKEKQSPCIIKYGNTIDSSCDLYQSDLKISKNMEDEGYYITAIAVKRDKNSKKS